MRHMTTVFYYDDTGSAGQRAKITVFDRPTGEAFATVSIRKDRGQGDLVHYGKYSTHSAARAAMAARGRGWHCFKRVEFGSWEVES